MKNKNKNNFLFLKLCFLVGLFILPKICLSESPLVISRVEVGKNDKDEYVEIYNQSSSAIDLEKLPLKLHLINSTGTDVSKTLNFFQKIIPPAAYFLITANTYTGSEIPAITYSPSGNSLVKNGAVYISNSSSDDSGVFDYVYLVDGYPHKKITEPEPEPPKNYSSRLRLNEILPNPEGSDEGFEWIELYNSSAEKIDLTECKLNGKTLSGEIAPLAFKVFLDPFTLTNTKFNIELLCEDLNIKDSVSYTDAPSGLFYSFDGLNWRWNNKLTYEAENKFNNAPTSKTKKDTTVYVGVYADFEAQGSDADNDKLKYTWDFGDGHKSYLAKTRHKYEAKGKYTVTLKISDGTTDEIKTDELEVKNYPEKNINIIEISPNPAGNDIENEYVVLQNKEKKAVNLNGWSIATGSKKLSNHPITEDLIIGKNTTLKVTRKFSKFSLPNKRGEVELRYPNGKVASKLKYDKGEKAVAEDEVFAKIDKKWRWLSAPTHSLSEEFAQTVPALEVPEEEEEGFVLSAKTKQTLNDKFINYASQINPPAKFISFETYPLLNLENHYVFTRIFPAQKHYIFSFLENLQKQVNFFLNN